MKRILQAAAVVLLMAVLLFFLKTGWRDNSYEDIADTQKYSVTYTDVFDTVTQIMGYADSQEEFDEKAELLHERLLYYHELFDIYHNYEDVSNVKDINDQAGKDSVKVPEEILDLMTFSKEVYQLTDGQTNVAMGSILRIWHDHRTEGMDDPDQAALPTSEELEQAARYCDPDDVIIDTEDSTVFLKDEHMSIDVGSIGKGYAVQLLGDYAKELGFQDIIISVGGNVMAIGEKSDGSKWKLGIQNPDTDSEEPYICYVAVQDKSVVTSGDYQRFYTVDGKRYCHIIDPDTNMPPEYVRSVTVITGDSALADGLSTALFNMPLEEGQELVESRKDVEAMWVQEDGTMVYSSGFSAYLISGLGE